jgi:hypothetical protein
MMLKVILCSGLYPQIAVPDDYNKFKVRNEQLFCKYISPLIISLMVFCAQSGADQVYHTKGKPFTVLHPMGQFANQPDILSLVDSDIILVPHMNTKLPISSKHQLVCFL